MAITAQLGAPGRSVAEGNVQLAIDNVKCGFLKHVKGGAVSAEVLAEDAGLGAFPKKHIGPPRYESIVMDVGFTMGQTVFDWIAGSWGAGQAPYRNGSLIACDYKQDAKSERQFENAVIAETTIPAMDASSKEPAYLKVSISPETARTVKASGKVGGQGAAKSQRVFLPGNFKLAIDGLDCSKINKISALTVKRTIPPHNNTGELREPQQQAGVLEFPNLKITLAEATQASWLTWFEDFVINGHNDDSAEKGGKLTLLSANLQSELAVITFHKLGIFRFGQDDSAGADAPGRVTAELYCESMEFAHKP